MTRRLAGLALVAGTAFAAFAPAAPAQALDCSPAASVVCTVQDAVCSRLPNGTVLKAVLCTVLA